MIQLPDQLLYELSAALQLSHNNYLLLEDYLSSFDNIPVNFNFINSPHSPLDAQLMTYLRAVNRGIFMERFLSRYLIEYKANAAVSELEQKISKHQIELPVVPGQRLRYEKEAFNCNFVLGNKLPFINREELKNLFYKVVNDDQESRYLLINGESGVGLSYTFYYLVRIGEITDSFKVVKVDFDEIFKRKKGQIQMVHVAEEILKKSSDFTFPYDLSTPEHFKYEEFFPELTKALSQANKNILFFFDQFNISYSDDVKMFIKDLVDQLVSKSLKNCYLVLAGFKDHTEWDYEVVESAGTTKIIPFTEDHLIHFLSILHTELSNKHEIKFSVEELVANLRESEPFFAKDLFVSKSKPNVTAIGRGVHEWLKKFKEEIKKA